MVEIFGTSLLSVLGWYLVGRQSEYGPHCCENRLHCRIMGWAARFLKHEFANSSNFLKNAFDHTHRQTQLPQSNLLPTTMCSIKYFVQKYMTMLSFTSHHSSLITSENSVFVVLLSFFIYLFKL